MEELIIEDLTVDLNTFHIKEIPTYFDMGRFFKTKYTSNKDRFLSRFATPTSKYIFSNYGQEMTNSFNTFIDALWENAVIYSYKDAFNIKNNIYRGLVFSIINVSEMVRELGAVRVKTEGIELINKIYDEYIKEFKYINLSQIYELYEVSGKKLGLKENIFAIKCWCTSTNNEHWIWTNNSKSPLEAISNTCMVYKSMLGKIKSIIRQGDVFLFEMLDDNYIPDKEEDIIPLTKEMYFDLLKSQS